MYPTQEILRRLAALEAQTSGSPAGGFPPARGFGTNAGAGPIELAATPTLLASVTVTPRKSGRFLVIGTAVLNSSNVGTDNLAALQIGHGGTLTPDFPTTANYVVVGETGIAHSPSSVSDTVTWITGAFPVGVPVEIDLLGQADVANKVGVAQYGAQISVVEME